MYILQLPRAKRGRLISCYSAPLLPLISLGPNISSSSFLSLSPCIFLFDYFVRRFFFSSMTNAMTSDRRLCRFDCSMEAAGHGRWPPRGWRRHALPMYVGTQENAARGNFLFRCDRTLQRSPRCTATGRCNARTSFLSLIKSGKSRARWPGDRRYIRPFLFFQDDRRDEAKSTAFRSVRPGRDDPKTEPSKFVGTVRQLREK